MTVNDFGLDPEQLGRQVFSDLVSKDWVTLLEKARLMKFQRGDVVVRQGSVPAGLYIVRRGWLRVERTAQGRTTLLGRRGQGELLGEMSVLENTEAMASVIAEEETELYLINTLDLIDLLGEVPRFATRYYRSLAIHLSGRLREAAVRLEQASGPEAESAKSTGQGAKEPFTLFIDPTFLV